MEEAAGQRPDEALREIILRVQGFVNEAQKQLWEGQAAGLKRFYDTGGEPLVERFRLSGGRVLEVPRQSLAPQTWLGIDEVEITFTLEGKPARVKKPNIVRRFVSLFGGKKNGSGRELYEVRAVFRPVRNEE